MSTLDPLGLEKSSFCKVKEVKKITKNLNFFKIIILFIFQMKNN